MFYEIPLKAIPNQALNCVVAGQRLEITLHTRLDSRLYISVIADGRPIVYNRICQNMTPLVDVNYLPLKGVLFFMDTQGGEDPICKELGKRYRLLWGSLK